MADPFYRLFFPIVQVLPGWSSTGRDAMGKAVVEGRGPSSRLTVTLRGARPGCRLDVYLLAPESSFRAAALAVDSSGFGQASAELNAPARAVRAVALACGQDVPYMGYNGEKPDWRPEPPTPEPSGIPGSSPQPPDWFSSYLRAFNALLHPLPNRANDPAAPPHPRLDPLFARSTPMSPFRERDRPGRWIRVSPLDLTRLGGPMAAMAETPFLLGCYRAYKHLVLGRDPRTGAVTLALPDLYSQRRAAAASAAGFPAFRSSSGDPPKDGQYGYWIATFDQYPVS